MGTVSAMATEVWMRNPSNYIQEALEVGASCFAWDRGFVVKRNMDPMRYVDAYIGVNPVGQRTLLIGVQGSAEYGAGQSMGEKPVAVYPTFHYGDPMDDLIKMMEHPAGVEPDRYASDDPLLRPVPGQEHRVIITDLADMKLGLTKRFIRTVAELQQEHPDCIVHLHGVYSWRAMFALGLRSVDIDPRASAAKGKVTMPHGKELTCERAANEPKWINLLGMHPSDLRVPRNRCMFNILAAGWAAKHYRDNVRWSTRRGGEFVDADDPVNEIATDSRIMLHNGVRPQEGDRWLCNICTLQSSCKFFREGAVCSVPDSEPLELAHLFQTRDSESIIQALGTLLATQTHRVNKALEKEEELDGLMPETTKMINTLFDRGVKLAKLVDPKLAAAGAARINVDARTQIQASSPQQLMAAVVQELIARGVRREDITPDMVVAILDKPEEVRGRAIEAAAAATA